MKNNSINNPLKQFVNLLSRYNLVIFIVLVTGGLILSIIMLNNILTQPYSNNTEPSTTVTTFDQLTINRLVKLETSAKNTNYRTLPSGRINPFSE